MVAVRPVAKRLWAGLVAAGPGLILLAMYSVRLAGLREDPSGSPGTPQETVIAVMVAALAVASFVFARAVLGGHLPKFLRSIGLIALFAGVCGLCLSVVVMT